MSLPKRSHCVCLLRFAGRGEIIDPFPNLQDEAALQNLKTETLVAHDQHATTRDVALRCRVFCITAEI